MVLMSIYSRLIAMAVAAAQKYMRSAPRDREKLSSSSRYLYIHFLWRQV